VLLVVGLLLYGYGVLARLNVVDAVPRGSLFGGSVTAVATTVGALYLAVGTVTNAWCWWGRDRLSTGRAVGLAGVSTLLAAVLLALLFRGTLAWTFAGVAVLSTQFVVGSAVTTDRWRRLALAGEAVAVAALAAAVLFATRDVVPAASAAVVSGLAAAALLVVGGPVYLLGTRFGA
jgi:hypothetical protein